MENFSDMSIEEVRSIFGATLKAWRKLAGVHSPEKASELLDMTKPTYTRLESGEFIRDIPTIEQMEKAFPVAHNKKEVEEYISTLEGAMAILVKTPSKKGFKSQDRNNSITAELREIKDILGSKNIITLPTESSIYEHKAFNTIKAIFSSFCTISSSGRLDIFRDVTLDKIYTLSQDLAQTAEGTLSYTPSESHVGLFNAWTRILEYCCKGSIAIASSIASPEWWSRYDNYIDMNEVAISNGVRIIRIFIFDSTYLEKGQNGTLVPKEPFTSILKRQHKAGIEVNLAHVDNLGNWNLRDLLIGNVLIDGVDEPDNSKKTIHSMTGEIPTVVGEQHKPSHESFEKLTTCTSTPLIADALSYMNVYYRRSIRFQP